MQRWHLLGPHHVSEDVAQRVCCSRGQELSAVVSKLLSHQTQCAPSKTRGGRCQPQLQAQTLARRPCHKLAGWFKAADRRETTNGHLLSSATSKVMELSSVGSYSACTTSASLAQAVTPRYCIFPARFCFLLSACLLGPWRSIQPRPASSCSTKASAWALTPMFSAL